MSDANEKQARHIADQLERMRWVFQTLFPNANVDPPEPIVVVAVRTEKTFETMEPAAYLAKGQIKLAGYFLHDLDKNYILLRLDAEYEHPYAAVYHEYTHVEFSSDSQWMPLWLNEGLAEFMQNTEIRDKDVLLGEPSMDNILYLRQNPMIPLDVLFRVDATSPYYHEEQKGSVFYAESWALTHYLMVTDRQKHLHRLDDYMDLLRQKEDPVTAAEKAFGSLKQLRLELDSYIRNSVYSQFVLSSAAAPIDEASYRVSPVAQNQADAVRADLMARLQRTAEARALLDTILTQDPKNVQAYETMGYLAFRAQDLAAAQKWYQQAVALDSQDYLAQYYFAALSMDLAASGLDDQIEASLRNAIRLNPRFAPAYDRLAVFYTIQRENLDQAHMLSLQAIELQPGNIAFRMNAANVLLRMGRDEDAAAVLREAAKVAKDPAEAAMVQSRLEQLQRIQAARPQPLPPSGAEFAAASSSTFTAVSTAPKYPTVNANGVRNTALGVMRSVACNFPTEIEFHLHTAAGKNLFLYNNNFTQIDLTAWGFTPTGSMNPCTGFEGMKARVQYVVSPDKTVDGQVVAVELRK